MPTYGYECTACQDQFEIVQSIKDDALTICQECGGPLRKKIYPVGIAFKGSGFYVNDYAKKSSGGSSAAAGDTTAKAEGASATDAKPSTESKADSSSGTSDSSSTPAAKPEAKSETKVATRTAA